MRGPLAWERQPQEPLLWWGRFQAYLLQGPSRSVLETVNQVRDTRGNKRSSATPGSWARNSHKWHWQERAKAWDEHNLQEEWDKAEKVRLEMLDRHRRLGGMLQTLGAARARIYSRELQKYEAAVSTGVEIDPPRGMSLGEARLHISSGITIERLASGLPEGVMELLNLTDEELRARYQSLLARFATPESDGSPDEDAGPGSPPTG